MKQNNKKRTFFAALALALFVNVAIGLAFNNMNTSDQDTNLHSLFKLALAQNENGDTPRGGSCQNCAFWHPYQHKYIPGLYIACYLNEGTTCVDTDCVPGTCY